MSSSFTKDEKYVWCDDYHDDKVSTIDEKKSINLDDSQINLTQENNSQYIPFEMPRYYDGIDLTEMNIRIHYRNKENKENYADPINVEYSASKIRFGWLVDQFVTNLAGKVQFEITANGTTKYGMNYFWRTRPNGELNIWDALAGSGVIGLTPDWYTSFVSYTDEKLAEITSKADNAAASAKKAQDCLDNMRQVSEGYVGWFETEAGLNTSIPTGKRGNFAIVGERNTFYVWDATKNKWHESAPEVDLSGFYTKDEVSNLVKDALASYCPFKVGQIYISMTDATPGTTYPGTTWEAITDCLLRAADDKHPAGSTGGAWTHSMSVSEMAKHSHDLLLANPNADDTGNPYVISFAEKKRLAVYSSNSTLSAGSGKPMNIENKYTAVYMWKRTA